MAHEHPEGTRATGVRTPFSRRSLFRGLGVAGAGLAAASCRGSEPGPLVGEPVRAPQTLPSDAAPSAAGAGVLRFLNMQQARTVEAITARLIPGDDGSPGAREAGAVYYIDNLLASHSGYPWDAYTGGPYAQTYAGNRPPPEEAGVVWVRQDRLSDYGWQSAFVPREIYRMGLARLDEVSRRRFGSDFVELSEQRQDELLAAVEDGAADVTDVFGDLRAGDFFRMVRSHTLQGFLADPVYGGNRDLVGWRLVGFPGSQRSYSPREMLDESFAADPQSLADLPAFNVDHTAHHPDVAVAVRRRPPGAPVD